MKKGDNRMSSLLKGKFNDIATGSLMTVPSAQHRATKRINIVVDMLCPLGAGLSGNNRESMILDHNGQRV